MLEISFSIRKNGLFQIKEIEQKIRFRKIFKVVLTPFPSHAKIGWLSKKLFPELLLHGKQELNVIIAFL